MGKNVLKYCIGALALVVLAVGVLYLAKYIRYRASPQYRAEKYFEDLARKYREDTYGGATPEETLQLFVDALKKGDVELASRYFIYDKQEKWLKTLLDTKRKGQLENLVADLLRLSKKYPLMEDSENRFIFEALDSENTLILQVDVAKGQNGKWKIVDL